jgi:hypothetical protein
MTPTEKYLAAAKHMTLEELLDAKKKINRQLAYSKVSDEFNNCAITAFKCVEVIQREIWRRDR